MKTSWHERHKEQDLTTMARWKKSHRKQWLAIQKRFREKHKGCGSHYNKTHRKQINANRSRWVQRQGPSFKLIKRQQQRIWQAFRRKKLIKNVHTIQLLGCSAVQLRDYIAGKFLPGMTWANHGKFGWHVDHIKPLASFDFTNQKQVEAAFHYTNLQPLWWFDNLAKWAKVAV